MSSTSLTYCTVDIPCELETMENGTEFIDYLFGVEQFTTRDLRTMPHLILLDLKMPKLSGLQVLQTLRTALAPTNWPPVVILTSSDDDQDTADEYRFGANSYIRKPVHFAQFTETVRRIVRYWLKLNVPLQSNSALSSFSKSAHL